MNEPRTSEGGEQGDEDIFEPAPLLNPETVEAIRERGVDLSDWQPTVSPSAEGGKKFKGYVYTCEAHDLGELVRRVEADEMRGIKALGETLRHDHATNCWIRGCQHKLTQVRLVEMSRA